MSPFGDAAIRIQFGSVLSKELNQTIRSFSQQLQQEDLRGVTEWVPTYTAVTVFYQPDKVSYQTLTQQLMSVYEEVKDSKVPPAKVIYIPTYYGGDVGPDLSYVAERNHLSVDEVISIHSNQPYLIYMIGFTPGFPYLGGMSKKIATPRLESPRAKVPAGSVGIAGEQTGVYSLDTPGGWQIIGKTPVKLYDHTRTEPVLLEAGNYLKFYSVTKEEYQAIEEQIENNTYQLKQEWMEEANDESSN
ncbi:5-oxoprolinase subunit PxpB [Desertibacillus haloalkaliphilus]|nr:5-oxoprolinase subunit PxpB [Desertibacillus haloalkaliphilus]